MHGFTLIEEKKVEELDSLVQIFEHDKSGARLMNVSNNDNNKVFSISFKTPPYDNTGVAHIIEHSVLCGSRKYNVKDPFIQLAKGSLNTYLNAMTFSDKTMYPVATTNEKDLFNLMDVYLDAVLFPNIYNNKLIFKQEGWHHNIKDKDSHIKYSGVVYNEMKGAFSSAEAVLVRKISESLYPDNAYGYDSGGDPDYITDLIYDEFLDFHRKYYHPSNSYIFLYGDCDLEKQLKFINEEYLSLFDKKDIDSNIKTQQPFNYKKELDIYYPILPNANEDNNTYFSYNYSIGNAEDSELILAFEILENILVESEASPIKKALLQSNICKDVFSVFDKNLMQPTFSIVAKNSDIKYKKDFEDILNNTLNDLVKNKIDKNLLEAAINIKEFSLKEADHRGMSKGLFINMNVLNSWLYGYSPFKNIEYGKYLNNIKQNAYNDYFENIINNYLLKNNHKALVSLLPKKGLLEENENNIINRLDEYKSSLNSEGVIKLLDENKELKEYQKEKDKEEDLNSIPSLSLEDIDNKAKNIELKEDSIGDIKLLKYNNFTNNIIYLSLIFDTNSVDVDDIQYISLLSSILGKVNTEKYSYEDISNYINIYSGGISFNTEIYTLEEGFSPKFKIRTKVFNDKMSNLSEIIDQIISHTVFNFYDRLKEIIQEVKSRLEMNIFESGHIITSNRVLANIEPVSKYIEMTSGIEYYHFICDLDNNFESKKEDIMNRLESVYSIIFNKNNMLISTTLGEDDEHILKENLPQIIDSLKDNFYDKKIYNFNINKSNEALITPGKVQYVSKGYNYKKLSYRYEGSMLVLKTLISLDYLWNNVRVLGGAYGGFINIDRNGTIVFSSYRDPHLVSTLDIYNNAYSYIDKLDIKKSELDKYIIGTISKLDFPISHWMEGEKATTRYIKGIDYKEVQTERDDVLNTDINKIKSYSSLLKNAMDKDYYSVLGSESTINKNKDIFDEIIEVFK